MLLLLGEVTHWVRTHGYAASGWNPARSPSEGRRIEIIVDSSEFMSRLEHDLDAAEQYAFVQTMSFEGDAAGRSLVDALAGSPALDRRLLIDSYSRFVISDKFRFFPKYWGDAKIREESEAARELLAEFDAAGVQVRLTNPMDPLLVRFMARNHKKIVVIDDTIAYLGGINFSDHNFAWHDMMLRIESPDVTHFLKRDFLATWAGVNLREARDFGGLWLALLDGKANKQLLAPIVRVLAQAQRSIFVESGYLSFPFFETLRAARGRGVDVILVTPERNNKPFVKDYLLWEAQKAEIDIRLYPERMSHLKAILVDDATLIAGSSNFDYISCTVQQELVAVVTDSDAVAQFRARVLEPDLRESRPFIGRVSGRGGWARFAVMRATGRLVVSLNRALSLFGEAPSPEPAAAWAR